MKNFYLLIFFIVISFLARSQRVNVGLFSGVAAYSGDITSNIYPRKVTNGVIGITINYDLSDFATLRTGINYAVVGGADRYSTKRNWLSGRNLSFETSLLEFNLIGEYCLLNLYQSRYSPYIFGGVAVYKFNPYTYDNEGIKTYLKPLGTEGQGIPGYPAPYKLTQLALPFGFGAKFVVTDNLRVGFEVGLRTLFTDYFDDVSTNYPDQAELFAEKGALAVDLSYRGDEVPGGIQAFPPKGEQRGRPKTNDYYYFTGVHLNYRLGSPASPRRRNQTGCPVNVY